MFNKTTITGWALAGGLWFVFSAAPARCDTFTPISSPNASYISSTSLLQIVDPLQSMVTSESQGGFSVSFLAAGQSVPMDINLVGDAWLSWGPSPQTEGATPIVLRPDDTTVKDVVFSFNKPLTTFGMEVEPDDITTTAHTITATFNLAGKPVGSIQRSVLGYTGAVLFAGSGTMFDSVEVTSDVDFAAGRFRYVLAQLTSLGGSIGIKSGSPNARVWPIIIGNNGPGVALGANVATFTLQQTSGTACKPVLVGTLPVVVSGSDIAPRGTAVANVTIDFSSCTGTVFFKLTSNLAANNGAAIGTLVRLNQLP